MYAFQELEVADNPAVIFRGIVGSHAYGTANAASDTDVRGVFVVPSCEYVRLSPPLFSGENIVKNGEPIVRFEGVKLETLLAIRQGED